MSYVNLIVRLLFVFLLFASPALAASVSVIPSGNPASFSVEGTGMDGVAGIQLDIAYDAASMATPTVTQGGLVAGAMFAANTTRPGFIKVAVISSRAFSGSGQIAVISFASKTGSGGITSVTAGMIDSKGSPLPSSASNQPAGTAAQGTTLTPGVPFSQTTQQTPSSAQQQGSPTTATPGTATPSTPTYPGTVTLPTDQQQRADSPSVPTPTVPAYTAEPAAAAIEEQTQPPGKLAVEEKPEETLQYVVYRGISDRFKQYSGSKNLSGVVALFDKRVVQTISQEPAILLTDGQSKATLTVDIPARISSSPNFAANGGTLVSLKQEKQVKGRWIVEVLPDAGAFRVTVTIIAGAEDFEYPLTVAPPVKTALTLDESGWNRFRTEVGTAAAPLHDLNNDGVRDYLDEFIFVANYLAGKSTPAKPAAPSKKSAK